MTARIDRQGGLSITELMVSVAISMAVLSSLVYVYAGSRAAYRTNEALARVQETGRFALEWISRDLREAGYMGCLSRGASITIYSNPKPTTLPTGAGIFGHEDGAGFTNPTTIARVRGDVVLVSKLEVTSRTYLTEDSDVVNANIKVADNCTGFKPGEFLVVTDCERAAVFTSTSVGNQSNCPGINSTTVVHAGSANGGADTSSHRISPAFRAQSRAFVARFGGGPSGYFIGNNRAGRPALYRFGGTSAEEVVENVEDLDFLFGTDTDGDGAVDAYLMAAEVTAANRWDRVYSVRVSLVAVSTEAVTNSGSQVIYLRDTDGDTVADAQTTAADRRLRQVFTTTVALRNRLP